jgi:hypothetical protein
MKYRLIKTSDEITIVTEDGGVACIRQAEPLSALDDTCPNRQSTADYYQSRIDLVAFAEFEKANPGEGIYIFLGEGKMYYEDWDVPFDTPQPLADAMQWLVVDESNFVRDDSLFTSIEF